VIDNFEHLIEAAADVAEILAGTNEVKILVTSREALRLRWEQEYALRPLVVPDPSQHFDTEALSTVAAVELFVERAQRARPTFTLTSENGGEVAEICRRLDGLPLAIELAAARLRVLSPAELLARLEHRLDTLSGGWVDAPDRHRALREAISWSHDLLTDDEQVVFRRISVFRGGCTLEAVEAVCATADTGGDGVLEIVGSLVDKSLVVSSVETTTLHTRFSLLETVREYGLERLAAAGEEAEIRLRHLRSCHRLAAAAGEQLQGPDAAAWLDVLEGEHDNLRGALDFAVQSQNVEMGLQLATDIRVYWDIRGRYREGMVRIESLLDAMPDEPSVLRGRAYDAVGWLTGMTGDYDTAIQWQRRGLAVVRTAGDVIALVHSGCEQAIVLCNLSMTDPAKVLLDEIRPLAEASGDSYLVALGLFASAQVALVEGDLATAVPRFEAVLAAARDINEPWALGWALASTGAWHVASGEADRARSELLECLALRQRLRDDRATADCLGLMACLASAEGAFEWAARLHGAAEIGQEANAVTIWPFFQPLYDASVERLHEALGPARLDQLWCDGRTTPMHDIISESLDGSRLSGDTTDTDLEAQRLGAPVRR
jgi:predicted ATPase